MDFFAVPGNQARCVCILVINDQSFRGNRSFSLTLFSDSEGVRTATEPVSVVIMDDDDEG